MRILQANIETTINIGRRWTLYPGDTIHIDEYDCVMSHKPISRVIVRSIHYKINGVDSILVVNKVLHPHPFIIHYDFTDVTIQWNRDKILNSLV